VKKVCLGGRGQWFGYFSGAYIVSITALYQSCNRKIIKKDDGKDDVSELSI